MKSWSLHTAWLFVCLALISSASAVSRVTSALERAQTSDLVVEGNVVSISTSWNPQGTDLMTTATLVVRQVYKGDITGDTLTFSYNGGSLGTNVSGQEEGVLLFGGERIFLYARLVPGVGYWVDNAQWVRPYDYSDDRRRDSEREEIYKALGDTSRISEESVANYTPLAASKAMQSATVSSLKPDGEVGIDSYSYLKMEGSNLSTSGLIRFRFDYVGGLPSWYPTCGYSTATSSDMFIEWSSNRIRFWPSALAGGGSVPSFMYTISSGPIQVSAGNTSCGSATWVTSTDSLDVKYNYTQWKWPIATAQNGINYWINRSNFPVGASYDTVAARIAVQNAFSAWDAISGADLSFTWMGYTGTGHNVNDGDNVIYWNNVPYTALTHWYGTSSGSMTDADIELDTNDAWLNSSASHLEAVMAHEIGHLLGFGDLGGVADTVANRLMYLRAPYSLGVSSPDADAEDGVRRVYGQWSGTLSPELGVTVWPDTIRLSGDVTVPSNDTLIVEDSAVLLSSGYSVKSSGTGQIDGNTSNGVDLDIAETRKQSVALDWDAYSPPPGYYLIRTGVSSGSYDRFELVPSDSTNRKISGLTDTDILYYFRVAGSSECANIASDCRSNYDDSDQTIDYDDFFLFADHYGEDDSDPNYEQQYDLSGDQVVATTDSLFFLDDFGIGTCAGIPKILAIRALQGRNQAATVGLRTDRIGEDLMLEARVDGGQSIRGWGITLRAEGLGNLDDIEVYSGDVLERESHDVIGIEKQVGNQLLIAAAGIDSDVRGKGSGTLCRVYLPGAAEEFGDKVVGVELYEAVLADEYLQTDWLVQNGSANVQEVEVASLSVEPNPFNPVTAIRVELPTSNSLSVAVYNILGQQVRELVTRKVFEAGRYEIRWDGTDEEGHHMASGVYVIGMEVGDTFLSEKMTLLR